jgi:hypothetical protein
MHGPSQSLGGGQNSSSNVSNLKPALINRGSEASSYGIDAKAAMGMFSTPEAKNYKVNFAPTMSGSELFK